MSTTFRAWIFTAFYFGTLLFAAVVCYCLRDRPEVQNWAPVVLSVFGLIGLPWLRARVEVDEHGITQTIVRRQFIAWSDVLSWKRWGYVGSDGPEMIRIRTRAGSVTLNHNCVYGRRLDMVEAELQHRVAQQGGAANRSQPVVPEPNRPSSAAGSGG